MTTFEIKRLPNDILIGRQTETGVKQIRIDAAAWLEEWPELAISIWAKRPGEAAAYPVDAYMDGTCIVWNVNDADTAISGVGSAEIMGIADGKKVLSSSVNTHVSKTTIDTTTEPPAAYKAYVDMVAESVKIAKDSADAAKEYAQKDAAAELERIAAEKKREEAETLRAKNEAARVYAESGRALAEEIRENAENQRAADEQSRVDAEKGRSVAEASRVNAEQQRVASEKLRENAEDARVAAETARVNAEALRQSTFESNEGNRQAAFESAETQRASEWAEIKSDVESSVGSAVASASDATQNANTAADNANAAAEKSVRYDVDQALSDAQMAQARENIDAASANEVAEMSGDLDVMKTFTYGKHAYGENIVRSITVPAGKTLDANSFNAPFYREDIGASDSMIVLDCIACIKAELEANETDYDNINKTLFFQAAYPPWGKGGSVKAEWGTPYWFYDTRRDVISGFNSDNLPGQGYKLLQIRTQQGTYTTTGAVTITYTALRLYANGI